MAERVSEIEAAIAAGRQVILERFVARTVEQLRRGEDDAGDGLAGKEGAVEQVADEFEVVHGKDSEG